MKTKGEMEVSSQERQMLELLSRGASSREMAKDMGYREGTMRVYLHNLYRTIGVKNKTSAVIWYLGRARAAERGAASPAPASAAPREPETFGDMALRSDLLAALGAMNIFLGGHGRMWEVACRLKGTAIDAAAEARRRQSRLLWEALLRGDAACGKRLYDEERAPQLLIDSPSDGVLLAALLLIGGYTSAADRLVVQVGRRRRGARGVTEKEFAFVQVLRDALNAGSHEALARVHQVASGSPAQPVLKHLAMASLYHAYLARKDRDRARATANAIWSEAENVREQLNAMGERPLPRGATLPAPARAGTQKAGARREKVTVAA